MIKKEIENIRTLFVNNKYDDAFEIVKKLIVNNSKNNELKLELAKIYFVKHDYRNSEKIFLELQKEKDFFIVSTEMLQKIYKMIEMYSSSIIQFYKLNKKHHITQSNIEDVIEAATALKRYNTFFKILLIAKNKEIFIDKYISLKSKEIYKEIVKLISDYNDKYLYDLSKKLYRKIIDYIPKHEKKIRNILLNEYEIATGCYKLKSKPRVLTLELTNRCNLKCIMCQYKDIEKHWTISDNIYNELLELMPYIENLVLQGGEVFLYKNIKNILDMAVKNNVSVEIVTNGLLLTEEILNILIKGKNIITFSIDSIKKEVYESIRVNGKFEKLIKNLDKLVEIKNLQKNNMILRLHMVVMRRNYEEIEDIINFAGKYGFNEVYLEPVANKLVEKEDSIFEFGYDKNIVSLLENKKDVFDDLAKTSNIKLINHLPSVKYCESLVKSENYNYNITTRKINIKDYLFLFKIRKSNNMNYNYTINTYKKLNSKNLSLDNKKMFCYAPWQKLSIYDRKVSVPTCFCPIIVNKIMLNPLLEKIKNKIFNFLSKKNFIISEWNSRTMVYYRKAIILQKEKEICAKDCLDNRILLKERGVRYD